MKYYIAGAAVVVTALAALVVSSRPRLSDHDRWRMTFVEPETKVRPERFEQMKFHGQPEVRLPASESKAKKEESE